MLLSGRSTRRVVAGAIGASAITGAMLLAAVLVLGLGGGGALFIDLLAFG